LGLVDLTHGESPPRRLIAGSDVIGVAEAKAERADLDGRLSASLALAPEPAAGLSGSGA
jgi:hypothetical protein